MSGQSLQQAVNTPEFWPTPRARLTGAVTPSRCYDKNRNLETALARELWPTPASRDFRHPNALSFAERGGGSKGEQLPNAAGGPLNPDWVEWLMGFPIGWTRIPAGASSPRKSRASRAASPSASAG